VPAPSSFDYALIRVVPRVERAEFINVGVIVHCPTKDFLEARLSVDEARLRALWPGLDVEEVKAHLAVFPRIAAGEAGAGPIAKLPRGQRFHWLVAPRSTVLQTSPVHSGLCESPEGVAEHLLSRLVRTGSIAGCVEDRASAFTSRAEALSGGDLDNERS
jgi:hypothetical protein